MNIVQLDPTSDPRWLALGRAPHAGLFHSTLWMRAVADAYGFTPHAYVALDRDDHPVGGVAFCDIDDAAGRRIVSFPFADTCDALLIDPRAWAPLREALTAHRMPITLRSVNPTFLESDEEFTVIKRARWHTLPLAGSVADIRARFDPAARRGITRAERLGLIVRPIETAAELADFISLHIRLRKKKYRLLAQPARFFASLATCFGEDRRWVPLGAFLGDRLVAATIYLHWGDTLYYKFNTSDPEALGVRPNNLLVLSGVEAALSRGCRALDLGPSDDDQPGLIRFKESFGGISTELRFLRWTPPNAALDRGRAFRGVLGEMTRLLTEPDFPDLVAGEAGAVLYRYFA